MIISGVLGVTFGVAAVTEEVGEITLWAVCCSSSPVVASCCCETGGMGASEGGISTSGRRV